MGLRSLLRRKAAAAPTMAPVQAAVAVQSEPLSPEQLEDLQAAWAELTEAAANSKVTNFHACTRSGRRWTEEPDAIRAVAAALRDFPSVDNQQTA